MKHRFAKIIAWLFVTVLASCSETLDNSVRILEAISITGKDFQPEGVTRSSVNITENGVSFAWGKDDIVGIFPNKGDQVSFAMEQGAGTQTATFSGGGWALKSSATYAAYYPHDYANRDMTQIPVSYLGQTQNGNASTAHLGAYDYMAASVSTPSHGAVAFDMQHLGCLVQLKMDLRQPTTIDEVCLKCGDGDNGEFVTEGYIDLTSSTPHIVAQSAAQKSNNMRIEIDNCRVAANEAAIVNFMIAPTNLLGKGIEVIVANADGIQQSFLVGGKNFVAGKAYAYSIIEESNITQYMYIGYMDADVLREYGVLDNGFTEIFKSINKDAVDAAVNKGTLSKEVVAMKGKTAFKNAPDDTVTMILIPTSSSLKATKDNGIGGQIEFDHPQLNTNGETIIDLGGVPYKVYGEYQSIAIINRSKNYYIN